MDKVQAFVESGKPEDLEGCTREELKQIVGKCGIRVKASKVAGMKDEILRQLRAKSEAAEQGAQKGAEVERRTMALEQGETVPTGKVEVRTSDENEVGKEKEKTRIRELELEQEKEKEKTRLEVEKVKTRLEVEKEKERTKQMQIEANRTLAE
ncbi:GRB10-interacting GYF protein 2-like [Procambarus clarkii]|uniref:GRB10-interacting GYF protein 2-like n=1 Tax=Procambarus clarkii TaxID=6728 RepID=UPI003742C405